MNEFKLQGKGWLLDIKTDQTISPDVKKKIYAFIQDMLNYAPSLNPSTPSNDTENSDHAVN